VNDFPTFVFGTRSVAGAPDFATIQRQVEATA
jgi:hypothetical protein